MHRCEKPLREREEDILQAVLTYQYLSVPQLTRLFFCAHSKHSANHASEYLKGLTEAGYLHRFPLPKTQRGTPAFIYTLSGKGRKHLASLGCDLPATVRDAKPAPSYQHIQHTLSVNDVLIAASLLPRSNAAISLECMRHEWMLKQRPLHARPAAESGAGKNAGASTVIPDGYLDFRLKLSGETYQSAVWLELDRGTEEQKQFRMKVRGLYAAATTDAYLREYAGEAGYLTIAFATTAGDKRARQLRTWIRQELTSMKKTADADLLLTASLPCPAALTPSELFLSPLWYSCLTDTAVPLLDLKG